MKTRKTLIAILTAFVMAVTGTLAWVPAYAATPVEEGTTKAADWIKKQWENGSYTSTDVGLFADGIIALASADMHHDTIDEMLVELHEVGQGYFDLSATMTRVDALAKIVMTLDMAGEDPATFWEGRDVEAELLAWAAAQGGKVDGKTAVWGAWGHYLTTIALVRVEAALPEASLQWLVDKMTANQGAHGGFSWTPNPASGDPDYTGLAISTLNLVAGQATGDLKDQAQTSLTAAVDWAQDPANQESDEAGNYYWTTYSSANSTGMVAGALAEVGVNIESPQAYMLAQQTLTASGAAWSNVPDGTNDDLRATVQAVFALTGKSYGAAQRSEEVEPEPSQRPEPSVTPSTSPSVTPSTSPTTTPSATAKPTPTATPALDIYVTEGQWTINGRKWRTSCEKYSSTVDRCRTEIVASTVKLVGGKFVQTTDWAFNNLTYTGAPRSQWAGNPLGNHNEPAGGWTATDGRRWYTECDTTNTGRGGCRSYIWATVYGNTAAAGQPTKLGQINGWQFNNMVRFK